MPNPISGHSYRWVNMSSTSRFDSPSNIPFGKVSRRLLPIFRVLRFVRFLKAPVARCFTDRSYLRLFRSRSRILKLWSPLKKSAVIIPTLIRLLLAIYNSSSWPRTLSGTPASAGPTLNQFLERLSFVRPVSPSKSPSANIDKSASLKSSVQTPASCSVVRLVRYTASTGGTASGLALVQVAVAPGTSAKIALRTSLVRMQNCSASIGVCARALPPVRRTGSATTSASSGGRQHPAAPRIRPGGCRARRARPAPERGRRLRRLSWFRSTGVTAPARTGKAVRMAKLWKIGRSGRRTGRWPGGSWTTCGSRSNDPEQAHAQ